MLQRNGFTWIFAKPPAYGNWETYFSEHFFSLTKASVNHENFVIMGDFIFDISTTTAEADNWEHFSENKLTTVISIYSLNVSVAFI